VRYASNKLGIRLFEPTFEPWSPRSAEKQIAVLMSGGVDSSVTAMLLKEAGWQVLGVTMKVPVAESCSHPRPCCGAEAALVCRELGVAHYFLDVTEAFETLIIEPFRSSYLSGRTPNPCVDCNTFLKFDLVWRFLEETFGIRYLATGHYARVVQADGRWYLGRAAEAARDQSYFVYGIARERLDRFVLPLGTRSKQEVRDLAHKCCLPVAQKVDSMELCFAGEGDYRRALGEDAAGREGPILDVAGNVIGRHNGIFNYTIGQRRGLGVAAGEPLYVVRICPRDNTVTLGTRQQVSRRDVRAEEVNILIPERLRRGERLYGKIRSYGAPAPCTVVGASDAGVDVRFDEPQFAPTPGQRLVLYDQDGYVAAGGTICDDSDGRAVALEEVLSQQDDC